METCEGLSKFVTEGLDKIRREQRRLREQLFAVGKINVKDKMKGEEYVAAKLQEAEQRKLEELKKQSITYISKLKECDRSFDNLENVFVNIFVKAKFDFKAEDLLSCFHFLKKEDICINNVEKFNSLGLPKKVFIEAWNLLLKKDLNDLVETEVWQEIVENKNDFFECDELLVGKFATAVIEKNKNSKKE